MRELDLDSPESVLRAFECRVEGLFLSPVRILAKYGDSVEGALFSSALLVAALIESLARVEFGTKVDDAITQWLKAHLKEFRENITLDGNTLSLAAVFEQRFRNGLAHNGYVASLGRLSGELDVPVVAGGSMVTVNPFALAEAVAEQFRSFCNELRNGVRDIRKFAYFVREQFAREVECARGETA